MKRKLAAKQRAKPVTIVSCITIKKNANKLMKIV